MRRRPVRFLVLLGASLLGAGPAAADAGATGGALEDRIARGPALADLLERAQGANPAIRAAREDWRATVERYRVRVAHENPEVMIEGMYMTETLGEEWAPDEWKVTLNQALPLPGRLGAEGEIAEADARIARLRLDAAARDVAVQVRESFHELGYLDRARRLAAANQDLLDQLRKAGEAAYAQNRAALVDVTKAQAQAGQLRYDALLLAELELAEKTRLNALLDRPAEAAVGPLHEEPASPVVYRLEEVQALAEAHLEEIRGAQAGIEKAQAMLGLARYENLPEVKLGATFSRETDADSVGLQATFMLPVWPGKNAGRIGEAAADVERMRAMRSAQVNEARALVRDAWFRLQNTERLVILYRDDLVPQAQRAAAAAETWFRGGQGTLSDYAEAASAGYNFQLALARAEADRGKFLARLEKLAGRSLTEREDAR